LQQNPKREEVQGVEFHNGETLDVDTVIDSMNHHLSKGDFLSISNGDSVSIFCNLAIETTTKGDKQ